MAAFLSGWPVAEPDRGDLCISDRQRIVSSRSLCMINESSMCTSASTAMTFDREVVHYCYLTPVDAVVTKGLAPGWWSFCKGFDFQLL